MEYNHTRKFIASSELFSDFEVTISLYEINSIDEIINIFIEELEKVLSENKLNILLDKLKKKKFHIHSYTIEEILTSNDEDIFYICDHQ